MPRKGRSGGEQAASAADGGDGQPAIPTGGVAPAASPDPRHAVNASHNTALWAQQIVYLSKLLAADTLDDKLDAGKAHIMEKGFLLKLEKDAFRGSHASIKSVHSLLAASARFLNCSFVLEADFLHSSPLQQSRTAHLEMKKIPGLVFTLADRLRGTAFDITNPDDTVNEAAYSAVLDRVFSYQLELLSCMLCTLHVRALQKASAGSFFDNLYRDHFSNNAPYEYPALAAIKKLVIKVNREDVVPRSILFEREREALKQKKASMTTPQIVEAFKRLYGAHRGVQVGGRPVYTDNACISDIRSCMSQELGAFLDVQDKWPQAFQAEEFADAIIALEPSLRVAVTGYRAQQVAIEEQNDKDERRQQSRPGSTTSAPQDRQSAVTEPSSIYVYQRDPSPVCEICAGLSRTHTQSQHLAHILSHADALHKPSHTDRRDSSPAPPAHRGTAKSGQRRGVTFKDQQARGHNGGHRHHVSTVDHDDQEHDFQDIVKNHGYARDSLPRSGSSDDFDQEGYGAHYFDPRQASHWHVRVVSTPELSDFDNSSEQEDSDSSSNGSASAADY